MAPFQQRITTPAAWTNRSIGGKPGLTQQLTQAQLAAFDAALARTRHLKPQQATRDDFAHPEIEALVTGLNETIRHGRGAVLLTGLSCDTHSDEDMERIYWGIGVCLGEPAVQSGANLCPCGAVVVGRADAMAITEVDGSGRVPVDRDITQFRDVAARQNGPVAALIGGPNESVPGGEVDG